MGYDLYSLNHEKDYFRFNSVAWPMILDLAKTNGWNPKGTWTIVPNSDVHAEFWDQNDYTKNVRVVAGGDLTMLADALESTLDDIPDIDTVEKFIVVNQDDDLSKFRYGKFVNPLFLNPDIEVKCPNWKLHPFDYFSGVLKQTVINFIDFCRQGPFVIW